MQSLAQLAIISVEFDTLEGVEFFSSQAVRAEVANFNTRLTDTPLLKMMTLFIIMILMGMNIICSKIAIDCSLEVFPRK